MKIFTIKRKILDYFSVIISILILGIVIKCFYFNSFENAQVFTKIKEVPIYSVENNEKKISITFDCACGADDIPDILNTLKKENIRATFFVVADWAVKYQDALRLIASDGHDVANHSYAHPKMSTLSNEKIRLEISKCNDVIKEITGKENNLFRAPYGDYNDNVILEARSLGFKTIQWDVQYIDTKVKLEKSQKYQGYNNLA